MLRIFYIDMISLCPPVRKKISSIILNIRNFYFRLTLSINNGICAISSGHEPQTILNFSINSSPNRIKKYYKAEKKSNDYII